MSSLDFHILVTVVIVYKIGKEESYPDFLCALLLFTTSRASQRKDIAISHGFGEYGNNSRSLGLHDGCHHSLLAACSMPCAASKARWTGHTETMQNVPDKSR